MKGSGSTTSHINYHWIMIVKLTQESNFTSISVLCSSLRGGANMQVQTSLHMQNLNKIMFKLTKGGLMRCTSKIVTQT